MSRFFMIFRNQREGFDTLLNSLSVGSKHAFFYSHSFSCLPISRKNRSFAYTSVVHTIIWVRWRRATSTSTMWEKEGQRKQLTKQKNKNKFLNLVSAAIEIPFLCVSRLESRCLITHGRTVSILIETCWGQHAFQAIGIAGCRKKYGRAIH